MKIKICNSIGDKEQYIETEFDSACAYDRNIANEYLSLSLFDETSSKTEVTEDAEPG